MTKVSPEELAFENARLKAQLKEAHSLSAQQAEKVEQLSAQALAADKRAVAAERKLESERRAYQREPQPSVESASADIECPLADCCESEPCKKPRTVAKLMAQIEPGRLTRGAP